MSDLTLLERLNNGDWNQKKVIKFLLTKILHILLLTITDANIKAKKAPLFLPQLSQVWPTQVAAMQ